MQTTNYQHKIMLKLGFALVVACVATITSANEVNAQWTNRNAVAGAGTTWLQESAIDSSNGTMITVGASGYIRTSTDGGASWTDRNAVAGAGTTSLSGVAAGSNGTMIAVGASGYIRTSTDGGASWTDRKVAAGNVGNQITGAAIGANNLDMIVSGTVGYIRTSTNGGASWTDRKVAAGNMSTSINSVAIDSSNSTMIAVGASGYIRTSTDGGASWTDRNAVAGAGSTILTGVAARSGLMIAVGASGYIRTSTNGGASWTDRNAVAGVGSTGLQAVSIGSDGTILVVGDNGYIRTSTDGGASWTDRMSDAGTGSGNFIYGAAVGPNSTMLISGHSGLIRTKEGNSAPTISINPSATYGSYSRTGPNNTPFTISFRANDSEQTGANALTYYIHTGSNRTGTQVATGNATSGVTVNRTLAYDTSGLNNGSTTLYLSVYDGTSYSSTNPSFTVLKDTDNPSVSSISTDPANISTNQYTTTFTANDTTSRGSNELRWWIRTAAGGGGTSLINSHLTWSGNPTTTGTITDNTLVGGANARYVRLCDAANNCVDASFNANFAPLPSGITTNEETNLNSYYATLNGSGNPNGVASTGHFRVFPSNPGNCSSDSGGTRYPALPDNDISMGSGTGSQNFSFTIPFNSANFLLPDTQYWYCAYAINSNGTVGASNVVTFTTPDGPASPCDPPATGNLTVPGGSVCAFQGTYNGVDTGSGTTNTGNLIVESGAALTVNAGQRIGRGTASFRSGADLSMAHGSSIVRGGVYVPDADGDGIIDSKAQYVGSTPPEGYIRRNIVSSNYNYAWKIFAGSTQVDCDANSAVVYRTAPVAVVVDADNDGYKTSDAQSTTACVGDSTTINGRTYYKASDGTDSWLTASQAQGGGATDCTDSSGVPCAPSLNSVSTVSQTSVSPNWTAWSSTVGPQPTSYNLFYCDRTSNGACTPNVQIGGSINSGASTYTHNSGITCGRTYAYVLRAVNAAGSSSDSTVRTGVTGSCASAPSVSTTTASNIGISTVTLGGNVTSDGGATVTSRGVCYSSSDSSPSLSEGGVTCQSNGSGTGAFSASYSGLTQSTTYYYRAYATNSQGTSYGSTLNFQTLNYPSDTFTDSNGVLLENHTMDVGTGWTKLIDNGSGNIQINTNRIQDASGTDISSAGELYVTNDTMSNANYKVSVTMVTGDNSDDYNIIAGRVQDANNMYAVEFNTAQTKLWRKSSGSWSQLGSAGGAANGSVITLNMDGSNISVLDDGTAVIIVTNSTISSAGKAGVGMGNIVSSGGDFSGQVLDNFVVAAAQTGVCMTGYLDNDGDGYGTGSQACHQTGPVVAQGGDCYDSNSNARPGQTSYFTTHRGDGSFDYNCANGEEHQYSGVGCFKVCNSWSTVSYQSYYEPYTPICYTGAGSADACTSTSNSNATCGQRAYYSANIACQSYSADTFFTSTNCSFGSLGIRLFTLSCR